MRVREEGGTIIFSPSDSLEEETIRLFVSNLRAGEGVDCVAINPSEESYTLQYASSFHPYRVTANLPSQYRVVAQRQLLISLRDHGMSASEKRWCLHELHIGRRFIFLGQLCDGGHYALIVVRHKTD